MSECTYLSFTFGDVLDLADAVFRLRWYLEYTAKCITVYDIKKNHTTIKLKKISIHSNILRANTHGTCYRRQGSFSEPSPCMSLYKLSVHRKHSPRPGPGSPPLCVRGVVWWGWWWPSLRGHIEPLYNTVRSLPPNDSTMAEKCKWDICRKSIVTSQLV